MGAAVGCKVDANAGLSAGLRAGAVMSTGAAERYLGRAVTTGRVLGCLTEMGLGCT